MEIKSKEYGASPTGESYYTNSFFKKFMIYIHGTLAKFPRPSIAFIRTKNKENKELIGAEIGIFNAANARNVLKVLPLKKYYMIDPFKAYNEFDQAELNIAKKWTVKVVNKYPDVAVLIEKTSEEAVNDIPNDLDFVYIDGDHSYKTTLFDMEAYYEKLKVGGVLCGHDIENVIHPEKGTEVVNKVAKALVEFSYKRNLFPYIRHPDWWVVKQ